MTKTKAAQDNWRDPVETVEVVKEDRPTWTGLYDHSGRELHRRAEPFGFDPKRWEQKQGRRRK